MLYEMPVTCISTFSIFSIYTSSPSYTYKWRPTIKLNDCKHHMYTWRQSINLYNHQNAIIVHVKCGTSPVSTHTASLILYYSAPSKSVHNGLINSTFKHNLSSIIPLEPQFITQDGFHNISASQAINKLIAVTVEIIFATYDNVQFIHNITKVLTNATV